MRSQLEKNIVKVECGLWMLINLAGFFNYTFPFSWLALMLAIVSGICCFMLVAIDAEWL